MKQLISLKINGESHEVWTSTHKTLLEVLREDLRLTGTKHGCELGECGACSVLIDGESILSCLVLPVEVQRRDIQTIEGLAETGSSGADVKSHPLQTAFAEQGASQCGYCSPAMLMTAKALLDKNPNPDSQEIRQALSGTLCRCTGYSKIIEAVEQAAAEVQKGAALG
jgi:aerobic-type carbon monoxide dehydrogenase small subunit (CoxS/CutS family)